jgi:fibronectin type 3 domain-containing protein
MNLLTKTGIKFLSYNGITSIIFTLVISINVYGQQKDANPREANISLISRVDTDSVVLRWAPTKAGGWVIANQIGYIVERITIDPEKGIENSNYIKLTESALKPLNLEEWKSATDQNNMFSAIAAQALYGKYFNPRPMNTGSLDALKNAADELTNRYSFSLFAADNDAFTAEALGLRWVDKNVEKDKKYAYRVYLAEKTDDYAFDTAYIVVDVAPYPKNIKPSNLRFESGDGRIKLFWEENGNYAFSGYYIFKSEDGGKSFRKLNDMPLVNITPAKAVQDAKPMFVDTATVNYKTYIYQVKGIDAFAGLSEAAEIEAFSKDLKAPLAPKMNKAEQISDQKIKLSWELLNAPDDLQGFVVSRSSNSLYNYQLITQKPLSKNTFEFIDNLNDAYEAYYSVAAVDTAGNMAFSVPVLAQVINDSPPAIPTGLTGEIDPGGKVSLHWNKGTEPNLKGYRVLWANDPSHHFTQLTGQVHPDTFLIDSINLATLTRNIYYRIAAVNNRYQHSEMSKILKLKRPDIIRPGEAVFADVFVTDTNVLLKWYPSTSDDAKMQILFRRLKEEDNWQALDTFDIQTASFTDNEVEIKMNYEYTIVTIDESGLKSDPAFPVMARPYDTGKRKAVENLSANYNTDNKTVTVSWNYSPDVKERFWYVIYKAKGDGVFKEYKAFKSDVDEFIDSNAKEGKTEYGVVVMTSAGGESEMAIVSITIEESR